MSYVSAKRTFYIPPSYLRNERASLEQDRTYVEFDHRLQLNEQVRVPIKGVTSVSLNAVEPIPSAEGMRWQDYDENSDVLHVAIEMPAHPFYDIRDDDNLRPSNVHHRLYLLFRKNGTESQFKELVKGYLFNENRKIERERFILTLRGVIQGQGYVSEIQRISFNAHGQEVQHYPVRIEKRIVRPKKPSENWEANYMYQPELSKVNSTLWSEELPSVLGNRGNVASDYTYYDTNYSQLDGKQRREGGPGEFCDRINYFLKLLRPDDIFDMDPEEERERLGFPLVEWQEYYYFMIPFLLNQVRVSAVPETNQVFAQIRSGPLMMRLIHSQCIRYLNEVMRPNRDAIYDTFIHREDFDEWCRMKYNAHVYNEEIGPVNYEFDLFAEFGNAAHTFGQGINDLCEWTGVQGPSTTGVRPHNTTNVRRRWNLIAGMTALCHVEISSPWSRTYRYLGLSDESHVLKGSGYLWINESTNIIPFHNGQTNRWEYLDLTTYPAPDDQKNAKAHFNFVDPWLVFAPNRTVIEWDRLSEFYNLDMHFHPSDHPGSTWYSVHYAVYGCRSMIPMAMHLHDMMKHFVSQNSVINSKPALGTYHDLSVPNQPTNWPFMDNIMDRLQARGYWNPGPITRYQCQPSPWRLGELVRDTLFVFMETQASSTMSVLTTVDFDVTNASGLNNLLENQSYLNLVAVISSDFKIIYSAPVDLPPGTNFQNIRIVIKNVYGRTVQLRGELAFYFMMTTETQQPMPYV